MITVMEAGFDEGLSDKGRFRDMGGALCRPLYSPAWKCRRRAEVGDAIFEFQHFFECINVGVSGSCD